MCAVLMTFEFVEAAGVHSRFSFYRKTISRVTLFIGGSCDELRTVCLTMLTGMNV